MDSHGLTRVLQSDSTLTELILLPASTCRDLIRRVATMYPPAKVVTFLQEGLLSKNNR